jgi:lipoyl(octanoyl) transferase
VTCHGFALNVNTDLDFYSLIDPCGIVGCQMTSIAAELGGPVEMGVVKSAVVSHFASVFDRNLITNDVGAVAGG